MAIEMAPGVGWLLNSQSGSETLLTPDHIEQIGQLIVKGNLPLPSVHVNMPDHEELFASGNQAAVAIRKKVFEKLNKQGFQPATHLPLPDVTRRLRDKDEIIGRLMALGVAFAWASAPPEVVGDDLLRNYFKANQLSRSLAPEEVAILKAPRQEAMRQYGKQVGWRLENMWPLAWVLGFDKQPNISASQIAGEVTDGILFGFLRKFEASRDEIRAKSKLRELKSSVRGLLLLRSQCGSLCPSRQWRFSA
jgi:hypothetical protein